MKNYFEEIITKLKNEIKIENITIIDNSYKHKKHKFFSPDKFHLNLRINSIYLYSLPRIEAQKMIFKILREDLKTKIHAIEINIEK